jgi:uncharacterized membrane protein YdbT with pleckstrin-like domain
MGQVVVCAVCAVCSTWGVSSVWTWSRHFNFTEGSLKVFRGIDELDEVMSGVGVSEEE